MGQGARMDLRVKWELTGPPTQDQGQMRRRRQNSEELRGGSGYFQGETMEETSLEMGLKMEKISTKLAVGDGEELLTLNYS